jgi:hypothetical protein
VPVDLDDRAINECVFEIRLIRQGLENPLKYSVERPSAEAFPDRKPLSEAFRQIAPGRTRTDGNGSRHFFLARRGTPDAAASWAAPLEFFVSSSRSAARACLALTATTFAPVTNNLTKPLKMRRNMK